VAGYHAPNGNTRAPGLEVLGENANSGFVAIGLATSAPPLLPEEQMALLHRIVAVLDDSNVGEAGSPWYATTMELCARPALRSLRPFIAHFLVHQVPARIDNALPRELHALLGIFEAITLVPNGAEVYLHQCLVPMFLLCLSPTLGKDVPRTSKVIRYSSVRKRAACLISKIALHYCDSIPELFAEVCATFEKALRRSPTLSTVAGAVSGLAALGPKCVERVLLPLVAEGLAEHVAEQASKQVSPTAHRSTEDACSGGGRVSGKQTPSGQPATTLIAQQVAEVADTKADVFNAFISAASTVAAGAQSDTLEQRRCLGCGAHPSTCKCANGCAVGISTDLAIHEGPNATSAMRSAALLCEAAAAALDLDPAPLLAGLPKPRPCHVRALPFPEKLAALV